MQFNIINRFSGETIYTAEINAGEDTPYTIKLGMAVKDAIKKKTYLGGADLSGAYLSGADLSGAYLGGADLSGADLSDADLSDANLGGAYLSDANLSGADLSDANLSDANLSGADLSDAYLSGAVGDRKYIKSLQLEDYAITYTATHMYIGCQAYTFESWWSFYDDDIEDMDVDGEKALQFWKKWKPVLQQIIALSPAEPTGYVEEEKQEPVMEHFE